MSEGCERAVSGARGAATCYALYEPRGTSRSVSSRRRVGWLALALALAALSSLAGDATRAQPRAAADPLGDALDADPLDVARMVRGTGDALVLARLASSDTALVLAALRAAPFLAAPEAALGKLATLAASRDPDLAPEAAHAMLVIARGLTPEELAQREAELSELAPARDALRRLAADASARADIRQAAALAAGSLSALVP